MSVDDVKTANLSRERLYAFLSRIFANEIDEELLRTIIAVQPTIDLLASSQQTEDFREGSTHLTDFVRQARALEGRERDELFTDLAVEYAGMLLAAGKNHLLTSESAYLGGHHLYYDKPYAQVKNLYRRSHVEKRQDFLEPEDHIAVELDFMANLCKEMDSLLGQKSVEGALQNLKLQKEFLRDHLVKWVPDLCESMKKAAESKLYKSVAELTKGFISMEVQVVDELTSSLGAVTPKTGHE